MLIKNRFGRLVDVPEKAGIDMIAKGEAEAVSGVSVPVEKKNIGDDCPYCFKEGSHDREECKKSAPIISIIIPSRWNEKEESITSLEAQTYNKLEIIVQKDKFKKGANVMRNWGFKKSTGSFVLFSDNDLEWHKDAIAILYRTLVENKKAGYSYGSYSIDGNVVGNKAFSSHDLWRSNYISTMSLIRREIFELSGGFDKEIQRFQDWDLWLTLLGKGIEGVFCGSEVFTTKIRDGITFGKGLEQEEAREIILKKHSIKDSKLADIIIPHQNRHDLLKECLDRLSYDNFNIFVISGGTFSHNCNKGAKIASTDNLIFMNDDIEPVDAVIKEMIESEEDIVGCAQINPEQGKRTLYGISYAWKNGFISESLSTTLKDSLIPTGFLFRIKKHVWEALGGLDETFKNGGEDQELFLSALEKGFTIKIIKTPTIHHHSQSRDRFKHTRDNRLELDKRWTQERVKKVIEKAKKENLLHL